MPCLYIIIIPPLCGPQPHTHPCTPPLPPAVAINLIVLHIQELLHLDRPRSLTYAVVAPDTADASTASSFNEILRVSNRGSGPPILSPSSVLSPPN